MVILALGKESSLWWEFRIILFIQDKQKGVSCKTNFALAEEQNQFYLRFDFKGFSNELSAFRAALVSSQIQMDEISVWSTFERTNVRESYGPDGISD